MSDDRKWEEIDLGDGKVHRMPVPETGVGNPASPEYRKLLSEEEEKSIDDKGNFVVAGAPWGRTGTGMYLVVLVTGEAPSLDREFVVQATTSLPSAFTKGRNLQITVGVVPGKPTPLVDYAGLALELPDDLGKDVLKQTYVIEWLVNTIMESIYLAGGTMPPAQSEARKEMGYWVQAASEKAIAGAGF